MKLPRWALYFGIAGLLVAALAGPYLVAGRSFNPANTTSPAALGGPFALTDHTGKAVTDAAYRGKYMLIYFGYTYCPDVCPTGLQTMSTALDSLGEAGAKVQPLFISVDPERDTIEAMKSYVAAFHPRLIGLTGTPEQIASVAKSYRAYYRKAGEGKDYLVDHTSITYLMGPDGRFISYFTTNTTAEEMAAAIRKVL